MKSENIQLYKIKVPQTIVCFDMILSPEYQDECIRTAHEIGDKMHHKTNVKASMSTYSVFKETNAYDHILKTITDSIGHAAWVNLEVYDYTLRDAWVSVYKSGDHTVSHNHGENSVSFCYYIKADEQSAPLVFDGAGFQIQPRSGLCVMFQSNVMHSVPKQKSDSERIILAGNYFLTEKRSHR